ncbi:hypothetical protein [Bryocella elongata]|nr:hypothetical protein [Bryocella elongata]
MSRLLETSHFRNSRRYPALLRFIVEEALAGHGEFLKERLIGVQVFGRPADYDTAADPVVRVTIAEVRKRIAQYYHDDGHDHEMRIELMPGSYEPIFRPGRDGRLEHLADGAPPEADAHPRAELAPLPAPGLPPLEDTHTSAELIHTASRWRSSRKFWIAVAATALLLASAGSYIGWRETRPTPLEELWEPIVSQHKPVTFILPMAGGKFGDNATLERPVNDADPEPAASSPWVSFLQLETGGENVVFADVTAMTRISDLLTTLHAESHARLNNSTTLDDLRQGPAVLIGGMDNQWALRVFSRLRYGFAGSDADAYWIQDHKDPANRRWSLDLKMKLPSVTRDYALIARIHDDVTGQTEMIAAGIGMSGTAAAGELLVSPEGAAELRKLLGDKAFRDRDFEAVLSTDVVNGSEGSAKILTVVLQ